MLFTSLLTSPWRWVLAGAAIILAIAFSAQVLDYASSWLAHRRAAKVVQAVEASQAARAAAEPRHVHHFDSTLFSLFGQHREAVRAGLIPQHQYDSLRHLFPTAVPVLPAQPPRYRPAD
jgi:hypothetical protein